MITLRDWMEAVNYRITESRTHGWDCYGPDAYTFDSWDGDQDGVSASIIFDTKTQDVYQVEVYDYKKNVAYRLIDQSVREAVAKAAAEHGCDHKEAWYDVNFIDLETDEDMLEKMTAIMNYEEYDTRVSVPIELSEKELLVLFKMAHQRDMTFNDFIEELLVQVLEELKRNPESLKNFAKS